VSERQTGNEVLADPPLENASGGWAGGFLRQRKLFLTLSLLLAGLGALAWATMIRQEDPQLSDYFGMVQVFFPGADAETVERLVLDPMEEHLAEVDEIQTIDSVANAELAVVLVDLRDTTEDVAFAWDRVRDVLAEARNDFPASVSEPILDDRLNDQDSIVYAITGTDDRLVLAAAADDLKETLLRVGDVARVNILADPEEQITIEYDEVAARKLGVSAAALVGQLASRSQILPGGSVRVGSQSVRLRPETDFRSVEEIENAAIQLSSGASVPLGAIARVRRGPLEPSRSLARFQGESTVAVGVVPRRAINLVHFGESVRERIAEVSESYAPLEIREIAFQPDYVSERLQGLGRSLLLGGLIVGVLLVLTMGIRVGVVVSLVVPLVALSSLAIFNLTGGVLHQISIAALVIALGMLVDNGIVMAESIQWGLDRGLSLTEASTSAVRELAIPLAGATATTLAAFIPMAMAEGVTAEFTRDIPIVIMMTLTVSYIYALVVTPAVGALALRKRESSGPSRLSKISGIATKLATARPFLVIAGGLVMVAISGSLARWVPQEFFPSADRNQMVVDLKLPEGTHLAATDAVARRVEEAILERPEVVSVASFVGRSLPRFYYNINSVPWSPHFGQLLVTTKDLGGVLDLRAWTRDFAARELPGIEVIVRRLEQGPPVNAPVEIRVFSDDLATLYEGVQIVVEELRATAGAEDVRHSLSTGAPLLSYSIEDAAAARHGISRSDVAAALFGQTRGLPVGQYRADDDPIPVVVRAPRGEGVPVAQLAALDVGSGSPVPLSQVADVDLEWRPGAIQHLDRRRYATVLSELADGETYDAVIARLLPRLEEREIPEGVDLGVGGAAEESAKANTAMAKAFPLGLMLLLGILMAEFRSFRRVGIILVTVPLAAAGVVPGLLIGGQPFGFMSLLGIVALVGIVVNNAIVLLEVIESRRKAGESVRSAVSDAMERRIRPILLTTATTVAGLTPLAFSESTLWPPLAWAMISGLTASALLTLLVVPSLYIVLFDEDRRWGRMVPATVATALLLLLTGSAAVAEPDPPKLTLEEAIERATSRPRVLGAEAMGEAARLGAVATRRAGRLPSLLVQASVAEQDRDLLLETPVGAFGFGNERSESASVTVRQPLLDPVVQIYGRRVADAEARAENALAERSGESARFDAVGAFLDALALDAQHRATESLIVRLEEEVEQARAAVEAGSLLESDALKVELALLNSQQEALSLDHRRAVAQAALALSVGLDGRVEPIWPEARVGVIPPLEESVSQALKLRADLQALRAQAEGVDQVVRSIGAERAPVVAAMASWVYDTGGPFEDEEWIQGSIGLQWNPFSAGTRRPRRAAAEAERTAVEMQILEAERGVAVEVRAAMAAISIAESGVEVGRTGVAQATETLRVERERYRADRITVNDLLAAEAALRRQEALFDLARLELVRATMEFQLAVGTL